MSYYLLAGCPSNRKHAAMMAAYDGHRGPTTIAAVKDMVPDELWDRLTGRELGLVMSAVHKAYHQGRASLGGMDYMPDDGCAWLPWDNGLKLLRRS